MSDLVASFPVFHVILGIVSSIALGLSYERILATGIKNPLANATVAIAIRFSSISVAIARKTLEMIVAIYKSISLALQPILATAAKALQVVRSYAVLIVNLTISTVHQVSTSLSIWLLRSPTITPYDVVRVFLPFLILFGVMALVFVIRATIKAEVRKAEVHKPRHSSRRAMQLLHDLDAPAFPSR